MDGPMPSHVSVIGGGRWARVYLDVLCGLVPSDTTLSAHARKGVDEMARWAAAKAANRPVQVTEGLPSSGGVAIVANAAADHAGVVRPLLQARVPVLVEKPITPSLAETEALVEEAASLGAVLAPSQVLLFTRYLENFAGRVREKGRVCAVTVDWADPVAENRYGEAKKFDGQLPIQADLLPHILPLISLLVTDPLKLERAEASRDGLALDLGLSAGAIPCRVRLERAGVARRRLVTAVTEGGLVSLDFTQEPGTIQEDGMTTVADPDWERGPRPLARMLAAFFALARGQADRRFDMGLALQAASLSDLVSDTLAQSRAAMNEYGQP
jgi:predicted dehydrogenase